MGLFNKLLEHNTPDEPEQTDIITTASAYTVKTDEEYEAAGNILVDVVARRKAVEAHWEPLKKAANDAHKMVCASAKADLDKIAAAEKWLRDQIDTYHAQKERQRIEAERRIQIEQENERHRLLQAAEQARAAGNEQAAKAAEESAASMPVASVQSSAPKVDGVGFAGTYEVEIVDEAAVPVEYQGAMLRPVDMSAVKALAKASKGKIQIPGIRVNVTQKTRVRT